jgi:hypothetical protein
MFRYESEMIPVLVDNLSKVFNTEYITTEFSTGNGVADLVFTTEMNEEKLFLNDYGMMSLFVNLFQQNRKLNSELLYQNCIDKARLKKLLNHLALMVMKLFGHGNTNLTHRIYFQLKQNLKIGSQVFIRHCVTNSSLTNPIWLTQNNTFTGLILIC